MNGDLEWVGLADRSAGVLDDLVLGLPGRVVAYQYKRAEFPGLFSIETLLIGVDGLLRPLLDAWVALTRLEPYPVHVRLVTNEIPHNQIALCDGPRAHSAAFVDEHMRHPGRSLAEWRKTRWRPFIDRLVAGCGHDEETFDRFLRVFEVHSGTYATFLDIDRLAPSVARQVEQIAAVLPRLVANRANRDRWTRAELLAKLRWRDRASTRHVHRFPLDRLVQRNAVTEDRLLAALERTPSGYFALVGPPGSGKSTLLQRAIFPMPGQFVVRYLAFVPNDAQGMGRGNAEHFLDDLAHSLTRSGLQSAAFRSESLAERRSEVAELLQRAGERFEESGKRTVVVVDGLDHVSREEQPGHSFLAELPPPDALPHGVLFVLGTQRLDLPDLRPAVRAIGDDSDRLIEIEPLCLEAVRQMADALELDSAVSRRRLFDVSRGYPLVVRYLVARLREADESTREALLQDAFAFDGDVNDIYQRAWRDMEGDPDARDVLTYLAHAEGPIELERLATVVAPAAIERALIVAAHLLAQERHGWTVFHNSFRLFILRRPPRVRLGSPDLAFSSTAYRHLATLARETPAPSPQRWLELRYRARAGDAEAVLNLATPDRFRRAMAEGRSAHDSYQDVRLALRAARDVGDVRAVFRLMLIGDELWRRSEAVDDASELLNARLALGDLRGAEMLADGPNNDGFQVVDALLRVGQRERARALFDRLHGNFLEEATMTSFATNSTSARRWAARLLHFRELAQIPKALEQVARLVCTPANSMDTDQAADELEQSVAAFAAELGFEVARTAVERTPGIDVDALGALPGIDRTDVTDLNLLAALVHDAPAPAEEALDALRSLASREGFDDAPRGWRRAAAIQAAALGDETLARSMADCSADQPSLDELVDQYDPNVAKAIVEALVNHGRLCGLLGEDGVSVCSKASSMLRPLQHHALILGKLLGRLGREASPVSSGEILRAARSLLGYLTRVQPRPGAGEFADARHLQAAAPVLVRAIVAAAKAVGEDAVHALGAAIDQAAETGPGSYRHLSPAWLASALALHEADGRDEAAAERLEKLVAAVPESGPAARIDALAELAVAFVGVNRRERAEELVDLCARETLGCTREPTKDPQYACWTDLLVRVNAADPANRHRRVALLARMTGAMARTDADQAVDRMATVLVLEGARVSGTMGLAIARRLVDQGAIGWAGLVDALLQGAIERSPERVCACTALWCELCLPFYVEPYFQAARSGDFLVAAVAVAKPDELATLVDTLRAAIETVARSSRRVALLERLADAAEKRDDRSAPAVRRAIARWTNDVPPPEARPTPIHHDIETLDELERRLTSEHESGEGRFYSAHRFATAARGARYDDARALFERWEVIAQEPRALFALVDLAIAEGREPEARRLLDAHDLGADRLAGWSWFSGASRLEYHRRRIAVGCAGAREDAFADLCGRLAGGEESSASLLSNLGEIAETVADEPDWVDLWDALAEQLESSREYRAGDAFDTATDNSADEDDHLAALLAWAFDIPVFELRDHARLAALELSSDACGVVVLEKSLRSLLSDAEDSMLEALRILALESSDRLAGALGDTVESLLDHADYAVAELAIGLCARWERQAVLPARSPLPLFYRLELDRADEADRFRPSALIDPRHGTPDANVELGWTAYFEPHVQAAAGGEVSALHVRKRCAQLIDRWGGLEAFGPAGTLRIEEELRRLQLKMTYALPHMFVALRAMRTVAGELRRASAIKERSRKALSYHFDCSTRQLPLLRPSPRTEWLHRPRIDDELGEVEGRKWVSDVRADLPLPSFGGGRLLAEFSTWCIGRVRSSYRSERLRVPQLEACDGETLDQWWANLPLARCIDGAIVSMSEEPALSLVRQLSQSGVKQMPERQMIICPRWLELLGWRVTDDDWMLYLDEGGRTMAKTVWWRDGGPFDLDAREYWGEGMYLESTAAGQRRLEEALGSFHVLTLARREVKAYYTGDGVWSETDIARA